MRALSLASMLVLLWAGTATAERPSPRADRNAPTATRCRSMAVTGSLARRERVCKTNAQWAAIRDQQGRDADDFISRSRAGMDCRADGSC